MAMRCREYVSQPYSSREAFVLDSLNPFGVNREVCFVVMGAACPKLELDSGVQPYWPLVS